MKLIKNVNVYAPEKLGIKDVFIAGGKICRIGDNIELPESLGAEIIDGTGMIMTPGFIDSHVHVLGGGGEGGFGNRTPEATLSGLTRYGITTVVGCLGTDGYGRDIKALVAKLKGLKEQGITAYGYTGSYQVPVRTLTENSTEDIMMIDEIIGVGEIAISDHRSSQPTFAEFARLCADARLGGILSGKAGIINIHLGDSPRCMDLIERVINETEIPSTQFLPTHVNRNAMLFEKALDYAEKGGAIDFTGNEDIDYWETVCDEVRVCTGVRRLLDRGISSDLFTFSSDGQGSLPLFSPEGVFLGMGMGQSSCLLKEVKECVNKADIPLEIAIKAITSNPAKVLKLNKKGKIAEGMDADLCILNQDLDVDTVIALGQVMVKGGEPIVKGAFE
ncbi:MAG: beta-aspartyl-peptidase [Firmicutes bacterium]|nr:beta-aspartyl-peptidase [Bacillota bacterium]